MLSFTWIIIRELITAHYRQARCLRCAKVREQLRPEELRGDTMTWSNIALQRTALPRSDRWMDTFTGAECALSAGMRPSLI